MTASFAANQKVSMDVVVDAADGIFAIKEEQKTALTVFVGGKDKICPITFKSFPETASPFNKLPLWALHHTDA